MGLNEATGSWVGQPRFLRDGYRMLVRLSLVLGGVILLMAAALLFLLFTYQPHVTFIGDRSGAGMVPLPPLSEPGGLRPADVAGWLEPRASDLFTVEAGGATDKQLGVQSTFTQAGFDSYGTALQKLGLLPGAQSDVTAVAATARSAGGMRLLSQGQFEGIYTWQLQLPMAVTLTDADGAAREVPLQATFWVQRSSSLVDNPALSIRGVDLSSPQG